LNELVECSKDYFDGYVQGINAGMKKTGESEKYCAYGFIAKGPNGSESKYPERFKSLVEAYRASEMAVKMFPVGWTMQVCGIVK